MVPDGEIAFLCDRMLIRLGRWLRAAGYDTAIQEEATTDRVLLSRALGEGRLLLTRDRKLTEYREAPGTVLLLAGNTLVESARALTTGAGLDWLHRPFTRCLVCNAPLEPAPAEAREDLPKGARTLADSATWCPRCAKLFWRGSHARRMEDRLAAWARGEF